MGFQQLWEEEKYLWHKHFIPSVIAGIAVAVMAYVQEQTVSNIVLIASIGSSTMILTNAASHHLVKLRTALGSYSVAAIIAVLIQLYTQVVPLSTPVVVAFSVFFSGMAIYLLNMVHPPAISVAVSFVLTDTASLTFLSLFPAILLFFIIVRLLAYLISQHLSLRRFLDEFKRHVITG